MDANPICQERNLEGQTSAQVLRNVPCFEAGVSGGDDGGTHLQGDELFEDLDALVVLWVLLDVGVRKERLQRRKTGGQLGSLL